MMPSEYTVTILADTFPFFGDKVAGYEVVAVGKVRDEFVTANQLVEITGLGRTTIQNNCRSINRGTVGKAIYNKKEAIAILSAVNKRGTKRKN